MNNKTPIQCPTDRALAEKHFAYLGYAPGEAYLRFFYHSLDPRKNNDAGRKESQVNWKQIEHWQNNGRGVYVVVNGASGGHTDADIKECRAIFCEWDDLELAKQFERWQQIGFLEPTFTVYSGDKSMQPYWVFNEPITVPQWRELQELLIEVMEADKSNKNPSRVFRLAGGWHIKPGREPVKSEIVQDSAIRYSYQELRDCLLNLQPQMAISAPLQPPFLPPTVSTTDQKLLRYKEITVPVPMPISLTCALGKSREFLKGVTTLRNTSMATLARDLIGVQTEFTQLRQTTNQDAYTLYIEACRQCSPGDGWNEREWEQIWNKAIRSNPKSSLSHYFTDGLEACIKGEYWRFLKSQNHTAEAVDNSSDNSDNNSDNSDNSDNNAFNNALRSDDKLIQDYNKISAFFGNRLRLNKLSKRIEINGKPISIDRAKIQLATKYGILARSGREDLQDILMEIAEQNEYSPIEEYLLSLPVPENTAILNNLAERYFGTTLPIYQSLVRRTLISAVARALSPGCKVDTALILQGNQGFQKSTFFKILAGAYFDDSLGTVSDKDERLKMHRAWFVEWAELETVFSRRDVSATKAFLSSSVDALRPPYHRDTQDFPRASIIVGSTNKDEFLNDETGNRRFWVVPVQKKIDVALLTQERDAIWAAAVLAYKSGEKWWLDDEEEVKASVIAQEFQTSDPWEQVIQKYIEHRDCVILTDILDHLEIDLGRQERSHQMRVAGILKILGWSKNFRMIAGKRVRVWEPSKTVEPLDQPDQPQLEVDREVDQRLISAETPTAPDFQEQPKPPDQPDQPRSLKKVFSTTYDSDNRTKPNTEPNTEIEKKNSLRLEVDQVDQVDQTLTQQGGFCDQPPDQPLMKVDQVDREVEIAELVAFVKIALESGERDVALDVQGILKEACQRVPRELVWAALSSDEKKQFTALLGHGGETP